MGVQSRQDTKSACIKRRHGAMPAGEGLEGELCILTEGCRIDWSAWSRPGRKTKRRAIYRKGGFVQHKCGVALLVRDVGVALLQCFYPGRPDMCICCLCAGVEIGRVLSTNISGVSLP